MATVLCYTSPARGHLYPTIPVLLELARRGHDVSLRTLAAEVPAASALGLRARPIDPAIEAIPHDDWRASSPAGALSRAARTFVARAGHEVAELRRALDEDRPDLLLIDFNCWGAAAVAEASGCAWRLPGVPPFGLGLAPSASSRTAPSSGVPFGRDQLEVARHVEVAGAGVRLPRRQLDARRLRDAIARTRARRDGAERVAAHLRLCRTLSRGAPSSRHYVPRRARRGEHDQRRAGGTRDEGHRGEDACDR